MLENSPLYWAEREKNGQMQECLYCLLSSFFLPHGDKIKHASLFLVGGLRGQNDVYVMCLKRLFYPRAMPPNKTREEKSERTQEQRGVNHQ